MTSRRHTFSIAAMLATLVFTGAAVTGCSADDEAPAAPDPTPSFATQEEFQLAFAECMRDEGIDVPDPSDDGIHIEAGTGDGFQDAAETCLDALGEPPAGPGDAHPSGEDQHEVFLRVAQCFRDNGIDVPDPAPGESLTVPMDAPQELFEECGTAGATGATQ